MSDPVTHEIDKAIIDAQIADVKARADEPYGMTNPATMADALNLVHRLRARAEAAEAERDRLLQREEHFVSVLRVADGGRYRNDWDGAIRRVLDERDALRSRVPTEDEIEALEVAVEELDALETRELAACGYTDAGPWLAALRALVARNTPKEKEPRV